MLLLVFVGLLAASYSFLHDGLFVALFVSWSVTIALLSTASMGFLCVILFAPYARFFRYLSRGLVGGLIS